jgi:hypothetical protein
MRVFWFIRATGTLFVSVTELVARAWAASDRFGLSDRKC